MSGETGKKMKLFHTHKFRSARCLWLIEELGIRDQVEVVNFNPYTATDEEMARYQKEGNPHGLVPALVLEDGTLMVESVAINLYLADRYQKLLPPEDKRPDYYMWSVYCCGTLDACLKTLDVQYDHRVTPKDKRNQTLIDSLRGRFDQFAARFDAFIKDKTFICGDTFTAADTIMGNSLSWATTVPLDDVGLLKDYPHIQAYLARLLERRAARAPGVSTPGEGEPQELVWWRDDTSKYVMQQNA